MMQFSLKVICLLMKDLVQWFFDILLHVRLSKCLSTMTLLAKNNRKNKDKYNNGNY